MTTLPPITTKQQEIIKLLYRYRFLDRTQIQALLRHKDKRRIISWLKDLREKQYVDWRYDATDFVAKSKPAIYYLSLNGIRYLRGLSEYPGEELRKRYKESGRTEVFIDRCLLIADCCIALRAKSNGELQYTPALPPEYSGLDSPYNFLDDLKPHMYFSKQNGGVTNYLLEVIDPTLPRYQLRKRIKEYVNFLAEWDGRLDAPSIALVVCPSVANLLYAKRCTRKELGDTSGDIIIRFTLLEKVKIIGVTGMIWEDS